MAHISKSFARILKLLILIDAESSVMFPEKSFRICTLCKFTVLVIKRFRFSKSFIVFLESGLSFLLLLLLLLFLLQPLRLMWTFSETITVTAPKLYMNIAHDPLMCTYTFISWFDSRFGLSWAKRVFLF